MDKPDASSMVEFPTEVGFSIRSQPATKYVAIVVLGQER